MSITINIPNGKYCNPDNKDCPLLKFDRDEEPYCPIFLNPKGKKELRISLADYDIIKHPICLKYYSQKEKTHEKSDQIKNWQNFSKIMEKYILETTEIKKDKSCHIIEIKIMIWDIFKYCFLLWRGDLKSQNLEKIAHRIQIIWELQKQISFPKEEINTLTISFKK